MIALLLAGVVCGLVAASYSPPLPWPLFWPTLLAAACLLLRNTRLAAPALAAFGLLLGIAQYHLHLHPSLPPAHVARLPQDRPMVIEGRVQAVDDDGAGLRIDLQAERLVSGSAHRPIEGLLRLTVGAGQPRLAIGQRIRFRSRLRAPAPFHTPGEFDYRRYLAARRIFVSAHIERAEGLITFAGAPRTSLRERLAALRQAVGRRIDESVASAQAPLVRALVIGDKILPPRYRRQLAATGLSHLFAISGLHLGLVALLLYGLLRPCYRRSERLLLLSPPARLLPLLLLPTLWFYLQLTGSALATRRAFLMAALGALLLWRGRRTHPLQVLATAALAMLCVAPLVVFEPAWQLSMAGVGGILLFFPAWRRALPRLSSTGRWALGLAGTTLAATIATTPLVLGHFHLLAPAGLLGNLLAVPLIGFGAVPLGLGGALLAPLWPAAGATLFRLCGALCQTTLLWAVRLTEWPPLSARVCYLPPRALLACGALALTLLLPMGTGRRRHLRWLLAAAALLLVLLPSRPPRSLTLTALSVGQGESLLLSRPGGAHYLVDGGGFYSSTFDVGSRLLGPALGRLGIDELEAVILTHDHPDHRLGLVHILEHFPVKAFWSALPPAELPAEILLPLQRRAIAVRTFTPGWTYVHNAGGQELAVFVPTQQGNAVNDRSLALYVRHGEDGLLLTGDLEGPGVGQLLAEAPSGPVTLLKLPHHGSRRSHPWRLLEHFQPRWVFASSGRRNAYGLPHREVVAALAARRLRLYDTGRDGTLRFSSNGSGWQLQRWQRGLFR